MVEAVNTAATTLEDQKKSDVSKQKLAEDLDQFMNLLVAQLQNQDPLDPMDANEFTSQLVQFAGVEQQIQANDNLEQMLDLQKTSLLGTVVGYIGTKVEVNGTEMSLENGEAKASYTLDEKSLSTTIIITDSSGKTVYFSPGEVEAGRHAFTWNGKDNFDVAVPDGNYTLTVTALDSSDETIGVQHTIVGTVNSVSMEDGIATLQVGETGYTVEQVKAVYQ